MSVSDHQYVNFSQDYELNDHLRKAGKKQSIANHATLKMMGSELKAQLGKTMLTHKEFDACIATQLHRLE